MLIEKEITILDFVTAISETFDMVSPVLNSHHNKAAYISYRIAQRMKIADSDIQDIVLAAMLHDVGVFSTSERIKAFYYDSLDTNTDLCEHSFLGYKLLKNFLPLEKAAELIRNNHSDYRKLKADTPIGSSIIHLADKVCVLLNERREIFAQIPDIHDKIIQRHKKYHPSAIAALLYLARFEYFWLETLSPYFNNFTIKQALSSKKISDLETLKDFAKLIAKITDFRSRFTAAHSSSVAAVARELSEISGFSERDCVRMEIAGLLHDLGKLSIPSFILEKNGKLDDEELNLIRKHTFYTYAALSRIDGLEDIAALAGYHHERPDGNGYPFHVSARDFPKPARIMAVADVLAALTEERPYRPAMEMEQAMGTLFGISNDGGLDKEIVELVDRYFIPVSDELIKTQQDALEEYESLYDINTSDCMKEIMQSA